MSNKKILVLSERIEHLNMLYGLLQEKEINSILVHGGLSHKMQKIALKESIEANIILSTSSYMGEGIDFPHLDAIIFTMPISFSQRIVQYLGRIGRDGQRCLAVDFIDENVPMLKSSFNKRMKGYSQMGYKVISQDAKNLFEI